jgi:hypothetical protein
VRFGKPGARGGGQLKYVPIPIAMLEVGKPLPVDILSASGQLLLRKGQPVVSEQHRDKLQHRRTPWRGSVPMSVRSMR